MRHVRGLVLAGAGAVFLSALSASAQAAAVSVFYSSGTIGSMWGQYTGSASSAQWGPDMSDTFAPASSAGYLSSSWAFNHSSTSVAPGSSGINIGGGSAAGLGDLNATVTPSSFSAIGHGTGTVSYGGGSIDALMANGTSEFHLKFNVPADAVDYKLQFNATGSSNAYTQFTMWLVEYQMSADGKTVLSQTDLAKLVTDGTNNDTDISQTWTNTQFPLKAGYRYVLDCYAGANFPPADAVAPDMYTSTAMFDVNGVVVPEPAVYAIALAGTSLLSVRRRAPQRLGR